jgi:biopolymer transport protein ExbD
MAAFAALFLLLALLVFPTQTSHGYFAKIAVKRTNCGGDGPRTIVVHVAAANQVSINGEVLPHRGLEQRLREVFSTRAERLLFLTADPDVPFAQVVAAMDLAARHVDHVALLTPSVQQDPGTCLGITMPPFLDINVPPAPAAHVKKVPLWHFWR